MRVCRPFAAVVAVLPLAGCFLWGSHDSTPAPIEVALQASDQLNPDEQGASLPTMVLVYQLKSAAKIETADFADVYRRPKESLGEDLLQADEVEITPGQSQTKTLARDKAAKALAVVAVVRRPAGPGWRSIVQLGPPDERVRLTFVLEGYKIGRR
ncbi:MAG: type VI secretion system lipoprotein TssJ [Myxococcales bacterium]